MAGTINLVMDSDELRSKCHSFLFYICKCILCSWIEKRRKLEKNKEKLENERRKKEKERKCILIFNKYMKKLLK